MTQRQKLLLAFAGPTVGIIFSLFAFSLIQFLVGAGTLEAGGAAQTVFNTILFLLGALCVLGIPVGLIAGSTMLSKGAHGDVKRGTTKTDPAKTLEVAKGWNWGAFLLTWIWGLSHGVTRSLWTLVPVFGWVYAFILGAKGNQWAWEQGSWNSIEEFRVTQRKWAAWGIGITLFFLIVIYLSGGEG